MNAAGAGAGAASVTLTAQSSALPPAATRIAGELLARLDRALPGRIEGFYVVGSACMGAFREGQSDVDFVAVVKGGLSRTDSARLRAVHTERWASALVHDVGLRRRWPLIGNGIYLRPGDLAKSPLDVTPLAGHVSGRFRVAERQGFDVNPVTWHVLARHGIAVRGPAPEQLRIHMDPAELRAWTLDNLNSYWRRWAQRARRSGLNRATMLGRRYTSAGVLSAPRLHYTIATGKIATKEAGGAYALEVFDPRWRPLIKDALAWWLEDPSHRAYRGRPAARRWDAAEFVSGVIDSGNRLG
ncbi:MAG: aminoglycoside adenylyltransferase domain-containing protein [Solirubrobacteraceae bacterium]